MAKHLPGGEFNRFLDGVRRAFKEGSSIPLPLVIMVADEAYINRSTSCEVTAFMDDSELVLSALKNGKFRLLFSSL